MLRMTYYNYLDHTPWNRQIIFDKNITLHLLDIYSVSTWTDVVWESDFTTLISIFKMAPSFKKNEYFMEVNSLLLLTRIPPFKKNILSFTVIVNHIYISKIICFCKGFLQKQEVYNKHIYFICLWISFW